jgi:hypothetical protein
LPQVPQCCLFCCVLTQLPRQSVGVEAEQVGVHRPSVQVSLLLHLVLQAPQWSVLARGSTHLPLQSRVPSGQVHVPLVHRWLGWQALPQVPQLRSFSWRLTHWLVQRSGVPSGHLVRHWPLTQRCPARQVTPQRPQCLALVCTSVQVP